jgi:Icc protein
MEPAKERAMRDELVGQADATGISVTVANGHAAVRELTDERLELWQSSPEIEFTIEVVRAGTLDLVVNNTMPAAQLTQLSGIATTALEQDRQRPTRVSYRLDFDTAGSAQFRLGDPASREVVPFRIGLMSDVQEAIPRVNDLYERMNEDSSIEFLLGAGDLTERGELSQLVRFEEQLQELNVPYYTTLGNHELGESPPPYQQRFGRANFSFVYRGAHFTLLDSASATIDSRVYGWLDAWLREGRDSFHVVAMHVPPIDPVGLRNGSFASRNEANKLFVKLLSGNVDLTLYGHLHSYFSFTNGGIAARVSGGGGAIPERFDQIGRHFLTIDIEPAEQHFETRLVQVSGD